MRAEEEQRGRLTDCTLMEVLDTNRHMSIKTHSDSRRGMLTDYYCQTCLSVPVYHILFCLFFFGASFTDYRKSVLDYGNMLS